MEADTRRKTLEVVCKKTAFVSTKLLVDMAHHFIDHDVLCWDELTWSERSDFVREISISKLSIAEDLKNDLAARISKFDFYPSVLLGGPRNLALFENQVMRKAHYLTRDYVNKLFSCLVDKKIISDFKRKKDIHHNLYLIKG